MESDAILQASLVADGGCSIYLPFGKQWFPYFMRRLGERRANIGFVLRAIFRERTLRTQASVHGRDGA